MAPKQIKQRIGNLPKSSTILKSRSKLIKNNTTSTKLKTMEAAATAIQTNVVVPGVETVFKVFLSARFCSAIWSHITDCDETFNYWEPLHYLIYGFGLQTWEYSPEYALRSYTYLLVHGVPGWIYDKIFNPNPMLIFYFIRCLLGICCTICEAYFYKAVCREFGINIGRLWLIFQLFSPGIFIASTALLPSSYSMYLCSAALAAWWHQKYKLSIFLIALSSILGWPFAALFGIPIAYDILVNQKLYKLFLLWSGISAATILIPMIVIDSSYYGKFTIAPLNIVLYNVFTSHGPNLYGVEPFTFYLINGFLNFNAVWILSLLAPVLLVTSYFLVPARCKSTLNLPHYLSLSPLYLWLFVFTIQPHKEERFLYPIYFLITLTGAISIDVIQKLIFRLISWIKKLPKGKHYLDYTMFVAGFAMIIVTLLGLSRIFALYRNYHAPLDLMMEFNNKQTDDENINYNVCVGKDWYRFPNSFFFPTTNYRLRFIKSEFKGILPAYYSEMENSTKIIHKYFNDANIENDFMYFDIKKCHYLFDINYEDSSKETILEPNYSLNKKEWIIIKSIKFLNINKSSKLLRSFYIPYLSDQYCVFNDFNLLKRKKF